MLGSLAERPGGQEQARILGQGPWAQGPQPGTDPQAFCELPKLFTSLSLVSMNANVASVFEFRYYMSLIISHFFTFKHF